LRHAGHATRGIITTFSVLGGDWLMLRGQLLRGFVFVAVLAFLPAGIHAQVPFRIKNHQAPLPMDQAAVNATIDAALKHLEDEYVYPETAAKMAQAIRKHQVDHDYAQIKTGQELAERLTKDLQAISHDKHLQLMCSTEKLPKPPERGVRLRESPAVKEHMRRREERINAGYRKVERLPGNIGYLAVDGFARADAALEPSAAAMNFLANTDALLIDVRRNHGGSPHGVALLCSYFFDAKPVHLNSLYWRKDNRTEEFWTHKEVPGKRYLDKDVYILTSHGTFSGGEEFVYDMQTQKRATVVGEVTGGGANPGGAAPIGDHFSMFVPSGRAINPITKTDWEGTGVKPDVLVPADAALEKAQELAIERLLKDAKDDETREQIQREVERSRDRPIKGREQVN
jgi:retinol-binding protein 3